MKKDGGMKKIVGRLFRVWSRDRLERELDEEIEGHLRLRTEALVREGLDPEEARREAERRFGDLSQARDRLRRSARRRDLRFRMRSFRDDLVQDAAYAFRRARRSPGATLVELAIFAVGVGLTTATFTLVDRVLLRPLPLPEPHRLVSLESETEEGDQFPYVSSSNWSDWQRGASTLKATGIHLHERTPVSVGEDAEWVSGQVVGGDFFPAVRMPMTWGRAPASEEIDEGFQGVVVTEGLWDRMVGGPYEAGRSIRFSGVSREVVGVVPDARAYPDGTELWSPLRPRRGSGRMRNNIHWNAVARLSDGATLEAAEAELSAIADRIRESDPEAVYSWGVGVTPLREFVVGDTDRPLWLLMGAVFTVLMVASANLAALNFTRAAADARETAVRRALGAGRGRIVRQQVTRQLLVALAGGGVGIGLAALAVGFAVAEAGEVLPRLSEISLDVRVAGVGVGVAVLAGLLSGLAPAVRASAASLRSARGSIEGGLDGSRWGGALVAVEVALAVLLVAGGGVLVRDFQSLLSRDLGFDPSGVITARTILAENEYRAEPDARLDYVDRVTAELEGVPGVGRVTVGTAFPTQMHGYGFIEVEGSAEEEQGAGYVLAGPDYFATLDMPLLEGRVLDDGDGSGAAPVTVISRSLARQLWPDRTAVGGRIKAVSMEQIGDTPAPWRTVVGVVADIRHSGFDAEPRNEMYVPYRQAPSLWTATPTFAVKAAGASVPPRLEARVKEAVRSQDPRLAVDVRRLDEALGAGLARQRLIMSVLGGFGVLATLLASLGVYGVISFGVTRRTRELGVRAALGARRSELIGLVLGSAFRLAALGALVGLVGAWVLRDFLEPHLTEVSTGDPVAFAGAAVALLLVSLLAALRPARRASRMDPVAALREA